MKCAKGHRSIFSRHQPQIKLCTCYEMRSFDAQIDSIASSNGFCSINIQLNNDSCFNIQLRRHAESYLKLLRAVFTLVFSSQVRKYSVNMDIISLPRLIETMGQRKSLIGQTEDTIKFSIWKRGVPRRGLSHDMSFRTASLSALATLAVRS